MENHNHTQNIETGTVLCADLRCDGTVCISKARYEELIRAEVEREILFHAYQQMDGYRLEDTMGAVFNPKFKYKRDGNDA